MTDKLGLENYQLGILAIPFALGTSFLVMGLIGKMEPAIAYPITIITYIMIGTLILIYQH